MARVAGSYQSVTRGVSQQVAQDRRPGQHWEQINMISDPVRGVARRHGSIMQDEVPFATFTEVGFDATEEDTGSFKEFSFFVAGVEYSLIYRAGAKVSGTLAPLAWCFNKDTGLNVPVTLGVDAVMTSLDSFGISSAVNVGKYVLLSGNAVVPAATTTNVWAADANKRKAVVWIRGGAYSRTFLVTAKLANGTTKEFSYKTFASSYPGVLDTSDIAYTDVDYQKQVNDRVNDYNTAVTQWIGDAAADIQPDSIAENLRLAALAESLTGTRVGSHLVFEADQEIVELTVNDGGDGSLMRGVGAEVGGPELVSNVHYVGKVVRVRPRKTNEEDAYYLQAFPKVEGATGWAEVTWREAAGVEYTPTTVFAHLTVVAGVCYIAGSPAGLTAISGDTSPTYSVSAAGDAVSSPLPEFFGTPISYLGLFQDRLVIGAGAVLLFSRPGDYFNWFRASVLTLEDSDPVEMFAVGAEDDTIRSSTSYDRNLVLFGERRQYTVSGRAPLTPQNPSIAIMSSYEDAVRAFPINSGNLVFYAKPRKAVSSMHQIQIGAVADSPESFEVSQQLDSYLQGTPHELRALTAPNMVALRTKQKRNGFYLYSYLDTAAGQERLFDAWYKWEWADAIGSLVGLSEHDGDLLTYTLRVGIDTIGVQKLWIVSDRFSTESGLSDYPYLDSMRTVTAFQAADASSWLHDEAEAIVDAGVAFVNANTLRFLGTTGERLQELLDAYPEESEDDLMLGINFSAYMTPTNPYRRDSKDKAIVSGRLTLGKISVSLADSGGMAATVETSKGDTQHLLFTGRTVGGPSFVLGTQPVVTQVVQFPVAKEIRECRYTLSALRWLPLTVTAIEWTGQYFNNSRRA